MLNLTLIRKIKAPAIKEKEIKKLVSVFNKKNKISKKLEIDVVIVGNAEIKKINKKYRKKNKITDVLSFNYEPEIGEIIISYPRAKKQAAEYKTTIEQEINRLIIHGLLHIMGHEHYNETDAIKMQRQEKQILNYVC